MAIVLRRRTEGGQVMMDEQPLPLFGISISSSRSRSLAARRQLMGQLTVEMMLMMLMMAMIIGRKVGV